MMGRKTGLRVACRRRETEAAAKCWQNRHSVLACNGQFRGRAISLVEIKFLGLNREK